MAPTSNGSTRRGRGYGTGNSGRTRRNAFTNAGVNSGQPSVPMASYRARGAHHRRRANNYRDRDRGQTVPRPSLASRVTYSDAGAQYQTTRDGEDTSLYQSADEDDDTGFSIRGQATLAVQANSHDPVQPEYNTAAAGGAAINDFDAGDDVDIDIDIDTDIDDIPFNPNTQQDANTSFSQQSALFCGSQPTQSTELLPPLSPSHPPTTPSALTFPHPSPTHRASTAPSTSTRTSRSIPTRMVNQPLHNPNGSPTSPNNADRPTRPINTYRGKDPIKRLVQNKKLQAIFADRPVPKERTKSGHEKMELRMGMRSASK